MDSSSKKLERVGGSLVVLIVLLVFAPSLFGGYVWDDYFLIVDNANVRDPASLYELVSTPFWAQFLSVEGSISPLYTWLHRPLIKLVYHFGLRLGDDSPFAFHVFLLALHLGCSYLVFDLIRAWLGERSQAKTLTALILATVFAIHPTRAENVAWISGITDVAMTTFILIGLRLFRGDPSLGRLVGGALAIALAGWSKETAVLAPALVLAQGMALGDGTRSLVRKTVAASLGAAAVAVSFVLVVASTADPVSIESNEGLARRVLATFGRFAARVVWPVPATIFPGAFLRGPGGVLPSPAWAVALGGGLLVASVGLSAWLVRRRRTLRFVLPLALFFVPLLPVSNIVLRSSSALIADRFLYLPLIGILLVLAAPLARGCADLARGRALSMLVAGLVILASASETLASSARFVDDLALFEHEVRVQPEFHEAQQTLIGALRQLRRFDDARSLAVTALERAHGRRDSESEIRFSLEYLSASVQFWPELERDELTRIRDGYGRLIESGRLEIEDSTLRFARQLDAGTARAVRSDVAVFRVPRAVAHMRSGDVGGAQAQLEALVRDAPKLPIAWELLGICRARRGDFAGAVRAIDDGLENLGQQGSLVSARQLILRAQELARRPFADPGMTTVRDANLQLMLGSPGAARELLVPLVLARPDFLEASVLLAQAEEADGLPRRALLVTETALRVLPNDEILLATKRALQQRLESTSRTGSPAASR